jgi:CHAT domain-containing protein/Flp pilus assembly protein TadD
MKRYLLLFLLTATLPLFAQTPDEIAVKVNELLANQQFEEVISYLNAKSNEDSFIDFALGVAHFNLGHTEETIQSLEKLMPEIQNDSISYDLQALYFYMLGTSYFNTWQFDKADATLSKYIALQEQNNNKDWNYITALSSLCYVKTIKNEETHNCINACNALMAFTDIVNHSSEPDSIKDDHLKNIYYYFFDYKRNCDNAFLGTNFFMKSELLYVVSWLSEKRYKEALMVAEIYKDSLYNYYYADSLDYSRMLNWISHSYMNNFYLNQDSTVHWVEDYFAEVEKKLDESNQNFYEMIDCCALIRQIKKDWQNYIKLNLRQLDYVNKNSIDDFWSKTCLMYGYICNKQLQDGLAIMQQIENSGSVPLEDKLIARNQLLNAFFELASEETNEESVYKNMYIDYAELYVEQFMQQKQYDDVKRIIENVLRYCFFTSKYSNYESWVNHYEELPNVTVRDLEKIYDNIAIFAENNYLYDIAIIYRKKDIQLIEQLNDSTLIWDRTHRQLKIEDLAFLYNYIGDCEQYVKYLNEGLKIRENFNGKINTEYIEALKNIETSYSLCFADNSKSIEYLKEILVLTELLYSKNSKEYYDELFSISNRYRTIHLYGLAMAGYDSCLVYYNNKYGNNSEKCLAVLGQKAVLIGETDKKTEIALLSEIEKKISKTSEEYLTIINNLASAYSDIADYQKTLYWYSKLEKLIETKGEHYFTLVRLYTALGSAYSNLDNFVKAEEYYNKGLAIILGENNSIVVNDNGKMMPIDNVFVLFNNILVFYRNIEDNKKMDKTLTKLDDFFKNSKINNPLLEAKLYRLKADYYSYIQDMDKAYIFFDKALQIQKEILPGYHPDFLSTLNNYAVLASNDGLDSIALNLNKNILQIREQSVGVSHPDYVTTLNNISQNYVGLDSIPQAIYYLSQALKLYPNNPVYISNMGGIKKRNENYSEAYDYYTRAKNIIEERYGKQHSDYSDILQRIIAVDYIQQKYSRALPLVTENISLSRQRVENIFSFTSGKQRENYWLNNQTAFVFLPNYTANYKIKETQSLAFNNALFSKGLLLRSSNEIRDAILGSGNRELIGQFESLSALRQQITALQTKADTTMTAYIESLETRADSLDKAITAASSAYREQKADMNLEWQDVQNSLADNEIAIEFIDYQKYNKEWTDTTLYAALIVRKNSENPVFVPLFEKSQLDSLLNDNTPALDKRISKLYNGGNPRFFSGQKLYRLVWQPLEKYLQGIETVYYSPSGVLNQVAFSAIPADSVCLADKYRLRLVSSTREVVREKKRQGAFLPVSQAVEYGGIQYDTDSVALVQSAQQYKTDEQPYYASRSLPQDSTRSGWQFLYGAQAEVSEVENILQKHKVPNIKYMGVSANEESFKALSGNSPALLHVATHGFFLQDEKEIRQTGFMQMLGGQENRVVRNPLLRSGLLFAGANRAWTNENVIQGIEDGILTAEEISNLNLSGTKLVVLSACETGLGEVQNSEGVFGLQRAFKLARVETLVMSLWKVDDNATFEFMSTFYNNLMSGKTKLEAFNIAQSEIREKYKNPYYWAAFVMMD